MHTASETAARDELAHFYRDLRRDRPDIASLLNQRMRTARAVLVEWITKPNPARGDGQHTHTFTTGPLAGLHTFSVGPSNE